MYMQLKCMYMHFGVTEDPAQMLPKFSAMTSVASNMPETIASYLLRTIPHKQNLHEQWVAHLATLDIDCVADISFFNVDKDWYNLEMPVPRSSL